MKRAKKFSIVFALVLFLGLIIISLYTISSLPAPSDLKRTLRKDSNKTLPKAQKTLPTSGTIASQGEPTPETPDEVLTKSETENNMRVLLNEDLHDIRVCENLGKSSSFNKKTGDLNFEVKDIFGDKDRKDPVMESFRYPLKAIFQDESVSSLLKSVMDLETDKMGKEEKESLLEKIGFYTRVASTAATLYGRKEEFEAMGDRAIHLTILTKLTLLNPELVNDSDVKNLCDEIERTAFEGDKTDVKEERKRLLDLIKKVGMTPKALSFYPDEFIKFKIDYSKKGLSFSLDSKNKEEKKATDQ